MNQAVHILMEGVPSEIDLPELEKALLEIPDVIAVHDLHVWTITSGVDSLTGHLVVRDIKDAAAVLKRAKLVLEESSRSITIQVEDEEIQRGEPVIWV